MKTRNNITMITLTVLTLVLSALTVRADYKPNHNPYVVQGVQLRAELFAHPADGSSAISLGPTVFQEIIPCRFISTVEADHYPAQWGGPSFSPNESRTYRPSGVMVYGNWTNPCSELIPGEALAVAARVWTNGMKSGGNGTIWLTPGNVAVAPDKLSKIAVRDSEPSMIEASVVLQDHMFSVTSQQAGADLVVDIIGYFLPDAYGRGDKGDRGPQGERGEQGLQGEKGEKGDPGVQGFVGVTGEKGDKGDKGDTGAQGLQGAKGDQGEIGLQGAKGDKGDRGEQGLQGVQGLKGDKGDAGAQGLKGDKGDKGDAGAQGLKGDKGERGEQGAQGAKGETGDKGATGERGAKGDTGAQGAKGDIGPMGPQGLPGAPGKDGKDGKDGGITMASGSATFPPPGTITIYNGAAKANSVIMLTYKEVSNGNALAVVSQSNGVFTCSGSPNKPFRYVILNYPE